MILGGASGSTVTLNGGGTLALSNSARQPRIYSPTGDTLVNSSGPTLIKGSGQLGIGGGGDAFALKNQGLIDANQSVALTLNPGNGTTNNGTFQANSGSSLIVLGNLTNLVGTTLTGGTYNVYSGTMQLPEETSTPTRRRF